MARWFNEDPEYSQITAEDKAKRDRIVAIMARWTRQMDYSQFGDHRGVPEDDYEDVAEEIMAAFKI